MAKVKLGNVRGPKGDKGDRGSLWRVTDKMTGQSTSDTAFPGANIEDSAVGDMCLNPITCDIYKCTAGGDAANAKWVWAMNNRGPQGPAGPKGDPTTVDAVLSKDSVNPIQNKAVATKFQDVQDSLSTIIKIGSIKASISRQYASKATVAAPQVEGYDFVAWIACVTDKWIASVYASTPLNSSTSIWVATHGAYTDGQGDVVCYALYVKSK